MTAENGAVLVAIRNVDKVFKRGSEEIHVLGGLDLEIPDGEFLALMGPSGRITSYNVCYTKLLRTGVRPRG